MARWQPQVLGPAAAVLATASAEKIGHSMAALCLHQLSVAFRLISFQLMGAR